MGAEEAAAWLGLEWASLSTQQVQDRLADLQRTLRRWTTGTRRWPGLRAASPRPAFAVGAALDMPHGGREFDPAHTGPMALRPGVTDRLTRGFVASVSSAANAGKSTYLGSEAVAIACERADVLGLPSIDWCGNVLVVSNEEDANTLASRWKGVMKTHGLGAGDFKHHADDLADEKAAADWTGRRDRRVTPTQDGVRVRPVAGGTLRRLASQWRCSGIDTLVSIFEGVDENSADMDKAMTLLIQIAEAGFMAIDVMQHQGKASGTSETTLGYRGSSAIFAALAEMSALCASFGGRGGGIWSRRGRLRSDRAVAGTTAARWADRRGMVFC